MKKLITIVLLVSGAFAADFSQMSTEEMMNMRGSVPVADRSVFQQEMQKRMQSMTPQERQKYKGMRGQGRGMGMGQNCMKSQPGFDEYDLNKDGAITQKELEEAHTKRMNQKAKEGKMLRSAGNAPAFATMDKNSDGILNQEEFRLHQAEHMKVKNKGNYTPGNCQGCKRKGPRTENKVVYDLRTGEAKNINSKLESIKAVANHYIDKKSDYKIAVVIGGDAYKFFVDDLQFSPYDKDAELKALKPEIEPKIRELAEGYDVNFTMCDVGIEYRAIPEDALYNFVEAKKTRSIYLIEFQNDGYAYIPIH
jgi:intracellular sulfur oxidation DsrE/DsrF family protein/Ca2+-binding EF-hand superfamily protein